MDYVWFMKFWMNYGCMFKSWSFLVIKKKLLFVQKKIENPWVPMNTHGFFNTHGYPHSGYPRGYEAGTGIIFIQRGGLGYHTIRTHGYPFTSLPNAASSKFISLEGGNWGVLLVISSSCITHCLLIEPELMQSWANKDLVEQVSSGP